MTPAVPTDRPPAPRHLTVSDVCALYPGKSGGSMHRSTVIRWITTGVPDRCGARRYLRATRVGSRWLVVRSDLDAFFAALAALPSSVPTPAPTPRTDADRRSAAARAAEALARRGA